MVFLPFSRDSCSAQDEKKGDKNIFRGSDDRDRSTSFRLENASLSLPCCSAKSLFSFCVCVCVRLHGFPRAPRTRPRRLHRGGARRRPGPVVVPAAEPPGRLALRQGTGLLHPAVRVGQRNQKTIVSFRRLVSESEICCLGRSSFCVRCWLMKLVGDTRRSRGRPGTRGIICGN